MILFFGAFIAGMLTVMAPCVLPLLPIIIGGSASGDKSDKRRPVIIATSLGVSMLLFTILLKATTLLIDIPPETITITSGGIIIALGFFTLFPELYAKLLAKFGIESKALGLLSKGGKTSNKYLGAVITGAALGPVFSSCSPVYGYILATILPVDFGLAMVYMTSYIAGLTFVLLLIGYYGQRFVKKIGWLADPKGAIQKIIGITFIVVGLMVATGADKSFQTWVSTNTPFNFDAISERLIPESSQKLSSDLFNVETPYAAPEFVGLESWINSEPKTIQNLEGKVVLVDFWTYSCINCIRNNPYIEGWYQQYKDQGLEVIGVHAPEFAFERNKANVEKAVIDQGLSYPVALDNEFATWGAFENRFWPAYYLIDAEGMVRRIHSGEGEYAESEEAIRLLLKEAGANLSEEPAFDSMDNEPPISDNQTAETYLGTKRASNYTGQKPLGSKSVEPFSLADNLQQNFWTLGGDWDVKSEDITALSKASIKFKMSAKEVYIVAASDKPIPMKVLLNGEPIGNTASTGSDVVDSFVTVNESRLYRLVDHKEFTEGFTLELQPEDGISLNAFTFGS
jgi:cytochrome c biogenesis protein CcdA/peroxiredoxin